MSIFFFNLRYSPDLYVAFGHVCLISLSLEQLFFLLVGCHNVDLLEYSCIICVRLLPHDCTQVNNFGKSIYIGYAVYLMSLHQGVDERPTLDGMKERMTGTFIDTSKGRKVGIFRCLHVIFIRRVC